MQLIKNQQFGGERPLFASHDLRLEGISGGTLTEASSPTAILHREAVRLSGTAMT